MKSLEKYYCQICIAVLLGKLYTTAKNLTTGHATSTSLVMDFNHPNDFNVVSAPSIEHVKILFSSAHKVAHDFALSLL